MRVAIVEDDEAQAKTLKKYVDAYRRERDYGLADTLVFHTGEAFLGFCENNSVDIVFMDIMMPGMDGMTVCEKIRERNASMVIVFVTDMAQFAVRGYKVDATDYIVKPVTEGGFRLAMDRAFRKAAERNVAAISVKTEDGLVKLPVTEITYAEVRGHSVIYHTIGKRSFRVYKQLKDAEKELIPHGFVRAGRFYLVNVRHVRSVRDYTMDVGGEMLQVSMRKKKEVLEAVAEWLGKD